MTLSGASMMSRPARIQAIRSSGVGDVREGWAKITLAAERLNLTVGE
jgi:hypothetical protein